jgi:hypothetical protein
MWNSGLSGLQAAGTDVVDLPLVAGHDHLLAVLCTCGNGPGDGELLDLATCTFAPAGAADADAGGP